MKKIKVAIIVLLAASCILIPATTVIAENANGNPAVVHLNFQVQVAQVLHLQIGSPGSTIDTVGFSVTDLPGVQPTVNGDLSPDVRVGAEVSNGAVITLSANSSIAMVGSGTATNLPFTTISCTGTGDFSSVANLAFNGTANQTVWTSVGRGLRQGTFSYTYANSYTYPPDTYNGQVTYTLSTP